MNNLEKGDRNMFSRAELKNNAKLSLKHFYLWGLLACFIYAVLSGEFGDMWRGFSQIRYLSYADSITHHSVRRLMMNGMQFYYPVAGNYYFNPIAIISVLISGIFVILRSIIGVLYQIFIVQVLEVGLYSFFLKNRYQETGINEMLAPFQKSYMNVVKVSFLRSLYTFLWSLLFLIPGIIKYYEYFFIPYLLVENPDLTTEQAIAMSRKMTNGEKWNIFVFQLSFLGWFLLATLLGGVGWVLVMPYYQAAKSELYVCLKERKL